MQSEIDWLTQFKPRIIKTVELESYDEYEEKLDGHLPKRFYRTPSSKMPDLFSELQNNEHSSYITFCNDAVKEGFVPQYISVLKKSFGKYVYHPEREAVVSKLLNYMGIPTTYNLVVKHSKIDGTANNHPSNEYETLSVDCIGENETFYSFEEVGVKTLHNVYGAVELIKKAFLKFGFDSKKKRNDNFNEVIEDFILSYMVRGYLLGDNDFRSRNLGLLYNSKTKHLKMVNYDYEQAFMSDMSVVLGDYKDYEEPTFLFIKKEYPKVYEKFMGYAKEFYSKLANIREIDLMRYFNKNLTQIFLLLKGNAGLICDYDETLNKKIGKYGKISSILSDASKKLKNDWLGM